MNYEQKYKEAVRRAKVFYEMTESVADKEWLSNVFPELTENDDEGIRKEIIRMIKYFHEKAHHFIYRYPVKDMLAWLEKQGEQKPIIDFKADDCYVSEVDGEIYKITSTDKVEPRFHEGDWVVNKRGIVEQIVRVGSKSYKTNYNSEFGFNLQDNYHLWTIADAKDGDVLHSRGFHSECIFIFDKIDNWKFDEPNGDRAVATSHCCITIFADNIEFSVQGPDCIEVNSVKPATEFARNLLFAKMKEAGYEWNEKNNEIVVLDSILPEPSEPWEFIHEFVEKFGRIPKDEDELNALVEYVSKRVKHSDWKEDDEHILNGITAYLCTHDSCELEWFGEWYDWLKSLKDRVAPQSNREWNEEDEKMVKAIIAQIDDLGWPIKDKEKDMYVSWLESLRPQNRWKPTSEQMKAFHTILRLAEGETYRTALSLYDDLKKLA